MDSVAKTSLLTAAMRAAETNRSEIEGRLFSDPYAELLAGEEGMALRLRAIAESGDQPAIAVRTHFMDQKFKETLEKGFRQIVILAAGMDTRAYRLPFPKDARVFELDREEVLAYKQKKLSHVTPQCKLLRVAVDLRDEWPEKLLQAGFQRHKPSLWLVEGLLMYLKEPEVLALMNRINTLAVPKDKMLFDVLGRSLLESPFMQKQLQFLANMGAPWHFGVNEPEPFMSALGWRANAIQPGEFLPSRWPFPVAPRSVPNVPRSFFVEADKL